MEANYSSTVTSTSENPKLAEEMSRVYELVCKLHAIVLPLTQTDPSSKLVRDLFEDVLGSCATVLSNLQNCSLTQDDESDNWDNRKRRKINSWTIITTVPHNDGHEWRKYGQKKISFSKFQRFYYRCTHKDQGCSATKTVQQKDGNSYPPKFEVVYNMKHTCKTVEKSKEISCLEMEKLENSISTQLPDHPSNSCSTNTEFTELDIEELLYEPQINTPPMKDTPNVFSPSWDFNIDIWDNIDVLLK